MRHCRCDAGRRVDANGRKAPLQAGMLLKAQVILDRRSLASWILDPLLQRRF
jgi:membrane fusion protein